MIGVGEIVVERRRLPARGRGPAQAGLDAADPRPQGRPGAAERHPVLHRLRAGRPCSRPRRLFQSALVTGALSTEAAKGSDTPFDHRIHALRRHRGQIETADALRALMAGSAIRASHLQGRRARAGPLLPALPAAGDGRGPRPCCARRPRPSATEANGVTDNPLIFADSRRGPLGRQLPRRAGGLRRRHDRPGDLRDRLARRAAHRHAGRPGALRPARLPDAAAGPEFRLHDPPGHRRGAGLGEQAARLSGQRRFHPHLGQPGGPRLDGRPWRAPAAAHGAERRRAIVGIELLVAAQGCDFHAAADVQRRHWSAYAPCCAPRVPHSRDDRYLHPDIEAAPSISSVAARVDRAAGAVVLPGLTAWR